MLRKIYLRLEMLALFGIVPVLLYYDIIQLYEILTLLLFFMVIMIILIFDKSFDKKDLFTFRNLRVYLPTIIDRFVLSAVVLTFITLIAVPDKFLGFAGSRPQFWIIVMIAYPMISVFPQELIYRVFMFHRYKALLNRPVLRILVSAIMFGWVHIVFNNIYAVVLSFIGGLIFGYTYEKSRSIGVVAFEHALYGDFIFTIGLGTFFFKGIS